MAENISTLLCNTIHAHVEEVDNEVFESGVGKVSCFPLKKKSAWFTVAHQLTFSSKLSLKTLTSSKGQQWFFRHMWSGHSHHLSKTEGYRMNKKYTRPSS